MRALILLIMALFAGESYSETEIAGAECEEARAARLVSLQGSVSVEFNHRWRAAVLDERLCEGSRVKVEANSRVSLQLPNDEILRLDKETVLSLNGISQDQPTVLDLVKGFVHFLSRTPKRLTVTTPIANAGPEGTEFALRVDDTQAALWVYEGGVRFFNAQGSVSLQPGQSAEAGLGQAPRAVIDLRPADAVSWALYYPPLVSANASSLSPSLQSALLDYRQGRIDAALKNLDALPESRDSLKIRAALRLIVGRVEAAKQDVAALLAADPNDADALALQSVAALTLNAKDDALALARRAVAASPQSVPAQSALSYAEQSRFELSNALQAAVRATELAPEDALAWARRAELEMANGLTDASLASAQKASALDPNLERTQSVIGFAELARVNIDAARQHFENAVKLDSTAPLARLGLGLAKIRAGELEEGRADLEIAATLDPGNSLIRSYLGKAYYEERRDPLARDQFDLAKQRDPKDPTPYFYDAIRKQTTNRPVEALHDMQQAIELNDNRAVYRSKFDLDEDLAARSASLGRIFSDLNFQWLGLLQGWRSIGQDPANYSAHRLLSDSYSAYSRNEISRVSELLQSQLYQPANMTPLQPRLAESNSLLMDGLGPTRQTFTEFNPLYVRDRFALQLSGLIGSNNTWGNETVHSAVLDRLSYSLGQFHYSTDGVGVNNKVDSNIYNAFLQYAINPDLNIQFEFRDNQTETGDLSSTFFRDDVDDAFRRHVHTTTLRGAGRYKIDKDSDFITSFSHLTRSIVDGTQHVFWDDAEFFLNNVNNQQSLYTEAYHLESQYLRKFVLGNIISGFGYLNQNENLLVDRRVGFTIPSDPDFDGFNFRSSSNIDRGSVFYNGYVYSNIKPFDSLLITTGISIDSMNSVSLGETTKINPKVGVKWDYSSFGALRAAYISTMKRPLISDQTIEPTQIAGFTQFYDDLTGSSVERYGIGIDHRFGNRGSAGI
ncbi:tetratricopeptide repeat protein, partial [Methylomonas koyamae]